MLVWHFPEPRDPIPISLGADMGSASVLVKLSDFQTSQFVTSQGAKGLMGTAGFIAPEILKYHGKEVRQLCHSTGLKFMKSQINIVGAMQKPSIAQQLP